jgi:galactokinase
MKATDDPQQFVIDRAVSGFVKAYHRQPDLVAFAPGRVNLIGEHTDYNDGFVLPCAIPFGTAVAFGQRDDGIMRAQALDLQNQITQFELSANIATAPIGDWSNHVRGVGAGLFASGLKIAGADIAISGNVPQGAGLSSSASLAVSLAIGLSHLAGVTRPDPTELAKIAQWSEHNYVGCACGIMDQLASARSVKGHAVLIDCRSLDAQPVPIPDDAAIVIVHSGVTRGLVDSAYNERREQCEAAAQYFGVASLRDLGLDRLIADGKALDPIAFRRARHVVTENARTIAAAAALRTNDLPALGALMRASHASLCDDFEVTVPQVDALVDFMSDIIGNDGGVRMTGGGFGGCVVALLPKKGVADLLDAIETRSQRIGLSHPLKLAVDPASGARCWVPS